MFNLSVRYGIGFLRRDKRPLKRRFVALCVPVLTSTGPGLACGGPCDDLAPTDTPREADLTCLDRWLDVEQSWPDGETRALAEDRLAELSLQAESLSDAAFYLRVSEITALSKNAHSGLSRVPVREEFALLPIRVYWFDEGLFVVRAAAAQGHLLGARVVAIAGHSPESLLERMRVYSVETDEGFRAYEPNWLFLAPDLLHAAGLDDTPESVSVSLMLPSGELTSVDLAAHSSAEGYAAADPWRLLHPDPLDHEADAWVTWLGETQTALPWSLEEVSQPFRYRFLADEKVAHVQFRSNAAEESGEKIRKFVRKVKRRLRRDNPRHIIWDQRYNPGGNLNTTARVARKLHRWLPSDGRVFSLTSHATFSAGIYTAFFPEAADAARTTVVGTRVGDYDRFWAESGPAIVLPETGWRVGYALERHNLADGCDDRSECHIRRRWNIAVGSLDPEVRVPQRAEDVLGGHDAVVEWVLREIGPGGQGNR
ncbi:MAG: hypothetical protein B7733_17885 [Myxococcales bacterium FL481]|nr:MAG: hypothetical protein B7733_17885 [Myxococcales bacterium FL481]